MDVIYVLIPFVLIFGFLVVVAFIWMAKKGFFDDMDGQASRILMDDEDFDRPVESSSSNKTLQDDSKLKPTHNTEEHKES